jgi:hypothetical protein
MGKVKALLLPFRPVQLLFLLSLTTQSRLGLSRPRRKESSLPDAPRPKVAMNVKRRHIY